MAANTADRACGVNPPRGPSVSEGEREPKQATKSSAVDEDGDEEAEACLYGSAYSLWLIVIGHVRVGLRRVIVGGRRVIVALRLLGGGLCFVLLSFECYSAVDLRFALHSSKPNVSNPAAMPASIPRTSNFPTMVANSV